MEFVVVGNEQVQNIQTVSHSASAFKITNQENVETAAKYAQPRIQYEPLDALRQELVNGEAKIRRLSGIIIRNLLVLMDFFHDFYDDRGFGAKKLNGVDNIKLSINTFINYLFPAENSFPQQAGMEDTIIIYFRDLTDYDEPLYKAVFPNRLDRDAFPSILRNFITFYRKNTWKEENLGNNQWDKATKAMTSHLMTIMRTFNGDKVVDLLADKVKHEEHFMVSSDVSDHRFDLLFKNHQSIAFSPSSLLDANGSTMGTLRDLVASTNLADRTVYFYKDKNIDEALQSKRWGVLFKELQDEYYIHPNLNPGVREVDMVFPFSDLNFNSFFHSYTIFKLGAFSMHQGREMYVPFKDPRKAMKCIFYVLRGERTTHPRCTCYFNVNTEVLRDPITEVFGEEQWYLIETDSKRNRYYRDNNADMIIFCKGFSLPGVSDLTRVIAKATELYNPRLDIVPLPQNEEQQQQAQQAIKLRNTIVAILISLKFSMDASIAQTPENHVHEGEHLTNPILLTQGDKSSVFVSSIHNAVLTHQNFGSYRPCNVLGPGSGEYNFSALNLTPRGGATGFGKKQKRTHTRKNKFGTTAARTSIDADCGEVAALKVVEKTLGEKFLNTKIELKPILGDHGNILMAVSMEDLVQQIVDKGRGTQLQTREYLKLKINAEEARAKEAREEARAAVRDEPMAERGPTEVVVADDDDALGGESAESDDGLPGPLQLPTSDSEGEEAAQEPASDSEGEEAAQEPPNKKSRTGAPTPPSAQQRRRARGDHAASSGEGNPFGKPKQRRGRWWYVDKKKTKTGYKLFRFLSPKYLGGTAVTPSYYEKITKKSFWKLSL
ncbi:MAG: hypothetical protein CL512_05485 [Actinobacteria bacterium]|nr:hypothetical protein [Actinomycetota bacterium]